jgi:oxepin-CoA hydrolase/3-oxo-5,6-dehydrosuberyl-CoA semialdehyde dehydrogenase
VHINAFNFPIWGMLEKLAPTLIAGVPAIVKPASQTAYLTELMVRRIVETGILPEGALQLVCGSVGDLLDHVTGQDAVTFTGSAATGPEAEDASGDHRKLGALHHGGRQPERRRPWPRRRARHGGIRPLRQGSRARDDGEGRARNARRSAASSPRAHSRGPGRGAWRALGRSRRSAILPDEAVRMGPLASLDQREEVRDRIRDLLADAESLLAIPYGVPASSPVTPTGGPSSTRCCSIADKPGSTRAVHDVEAFGPVDGHAL